MPKQKWIIEQLLPVGGALYFYGMPKTGKSLFALGMGAAVSDGHSKFLDFPVHVHGKVLYLQIDMPPTLWYSYVEKSIQHGNHTLNDMYFIDRWELPDRALDVLSPKHQDFLQKEVAQTQPTLIIFDTLRAIHKADENDNTLMSNVYEAILKIAQGAAFILVHHAKKPGMYEDIVSDARGATSVSGRVDVIAKLSGKKASARKLEYTTRDREMHPDGLDLFQLPDSGLYQIKHNAMLLLENFIITNPEPTKPEMINFLTGYGFNSKYAYDVIRKVAKKMKGEGD